MDLFNDTSLFKRIKLGDEQAFEILFNAFYPSLCHYAFQFIGEEETAEEITQDIFVKLWEKRFSLDIETSVKNYLFRSVKNRCLNLIQHNKVKNQHAGQIMERAVQELNPSQYFLEPGLAEKIEAAINSLPEKRQEIFRLSREEGLKYKEIAEKLNISVKTVEAQMGLALKFLRKQLKEYDPNVILYFF